MMKKLSAILGASLCIASVTAFADSAIQTPTQSSPKHSGFYLGAQGGYSRVNFSDADNHGFGFSPFIGYQFNSYWAVETGYLQFANVTSDLVDPTVTINHNHAFYGAVKGILPIGSRANLYGKIGAASVSNTYSVDTVIFNDDDAVIVSKGAHRNTCFYAAIGTSYFVTQQVALNLEVASTAKNGLVTPAMGAVMAGVSFYF